MTLRASHEVLRGVLRVADELCGLSAGDIEEITGIEVERIRELDAGVGEAPTATEVALILFGAIDRTLAEQEAVNPLFEKLGMIVEAEKPRQARWLVLASIEKLFVDVEIEQREAERQSDPAKQQVKL